MSVKPNALSIERLFVRGFRNLEALDLSPGAGVNVVYGDNGAGKSNLLEAIYYLGALRSFRGARAEDLIEVSQPHARLRARTGLEDAPRVLDISLTRGEARKVSVDGKKPRSMAQYYAEVPMVLFYPGQLDLAAGGAEGRRAFLDRILEQLSLSYGPSLSAYEKARASRNRLLKQDSPDRRAIAAFDALLAEHGAVVGRARARLLEVLGPRVERAFAAIMGEELPLAVRYVPRVEPSPDAIREALSRSLSKDLARGFTAEGPHGDDIALALRAVPARHHASQGQHRAMVLALKVAELEVMTKKLGRVPILLLDDVSSELDRGRNRRLFELLSGFGGQIFLTTTHPEFILLEGERRELHVVGGRVTPSAR